MQGKQRRQPRKKCPPTPQYVHTQRHANIEELFHPKFLFLLTFPAFKKTKLANRKKHPSPLHISAKVAHSDIARSENYNSFLNSDRSHTIHQAVIILKYYITCENSCHLVTMAVVPTGFPLHPHPNTHLSTVH